jgi:acyl carrier protein
MTVPSNPVLDVIRAEVSALLCSQPNTSIERATLIKEVLDSMLFVGLLVRVEKYFSIEISDQTIYENSIVTFGDLADCVYAQRLALDKQAVGSS